MLACKWVYDICIYYFPIFIYIIYIIIVIITIIFVLMIWYPFPLPSIYWKQNSFKSMQWISQAESLDQYDMMIHRCIIKKYVWILCVPIQLIIAIKAISTTGFYIKHQICPSYFPAAQQGQCSSPTRSTGGGHRTAWLRKSHVAALVRTCGFSTGWFHFYSFAFAGAAWWKMWGCGCSKFEERLIETKHIWECDTGVRGRFSWRWSSFKPKNAQNYIDWNGFIPALLAPSL